MFKIKIINQKDNANYITEEEIYLPNIAAVRDFLVSRKSWYVKYKTYRSRYKNQFGSYTVDYVVEEIVSEANLS